VESTGELAAVGRGDGPVEILAVIPNEADVERRLEGWAHARLGGATLRWARQRAHGWNVPLPPSGKSLLIRDNAPPKPWPDPPAPSVGRTTGAYAGAQNDGEYLVEVVEPGVAKRQLYHYVESSPTGLAWGYLGAGPSDMARSLLADRLGYVPARTICHRFRDELVAALEAEFVLSFTEVDAWIDGNAHLFAEDPRAQVHDPIAAGGAD
jgi:hypothetical protein